MMETKTVNIEQPVRKLTTRVMNRAIYYVSGFYGLFAMLFGAKVLPIFLFYVSILCFINVRYIDLKELMKK